MPEEGVREFDLEIEFGGLCLFLWGGENFVDIIMPDARYDRPAPPATTHHAGYIRFDMANLPLAGAGLALPPGASGPYCEAVHRFNREELRLVVSLPGGSEASLGDSGARIGRSGLTVPDFSEFAPIMDPLPALREGENPEGVLMRMRLYNGDFPPSAATKNWKMAGTLNTGKETPLAVSGTVLWKRRVTGDGMFLELVRMADGGSVRIPLVPVGGSIRLKVANLCDNPLEWGELSPPPPAGPDYDFRWHYRLMQMKPEMPCHYDEDCYPVPKPVDRGMLQPCLPAQATPGAVRAGAGARPVAVHP